MDRHTIRKREMVTLYVRIPIALYNALVDYANVTNKTLAATTIEWLGERLKDQRGELDPKYS